MNNFRELNLEYLQPKSFFVSVIVIVIIVISVITIMITTVIVNMIAIIIFYLFFFFISYAIWYLATLSLLLWSKRKTHLEA